MNRELKRVAVWHNVTREIFERDIVPLYEPAILKSHVNHWPSVKAAQQGEQKLCDYLTSIYIGGDVRFARLASKFNGLFSYNEEMTDLNFRREVGPLSSFLNEVLANASEEGVDTLALQSAPIPDYFPKFMSNNSFSLFDETVSPRIWIGNNAVVAAHYDDAENVACLVSGKRRFTLFPPNQIDNLYIGPIDLTPAGAPVSLVDFSQPDFEKYPKFSLALEQALVADLEPGDALYIPSLWWHHVQSSGGVNTLVNYWSGGSIAGTVKPVPMDNLLMSLLNIRGLPQGQKEAWQAIFNYYVFSDQTQKQDHIPKRAQGMLARLSQKQQSDMRKWLISQLK